MVATAVLALLATMMARALPLPPAAVAVAGFLVDYLSHLLVDMASVCLVTARLCRSW
jgi:hypothetical protein